VAKRLLATYREALSDYHLHAEAKFLNAEPFDRGRTIRQPVRATAVELIGKEANRWEEQFYLGEDEEAQIVYGLLPASDAFHNRLSRFVNRFGLSRVAEWAGVSRPVLTKLCRSKAAPTHRTRERLEEAFVILDGHEAKERAQKKKMHERLKERAAEIGHNQLAAELEVDRANLSAMLAGRRGVLAKMTPVQR
jgi:plasmid maintenance system antidote protein VapI